MVFGLHAVVFVNCSVISFVLTGACAHMIFITSNSASDIFGKEFTTLVSFMLASCFPFIINVILIVVNAGIFERPFSGRKESKLLLDGTE